MTPITPRTPRSRLARPAEEVLARRWLTLAVLVLVAAGLFALAVVVGRMPPFDRFVTDPLFFKRCLVAHVNLALVCWFYSFIAVLLSLAPAGGATSAVSRGSVWIASVGVAGILIGAAIPGAQPLLSNYIPTIDHWVFRSGQLTFGVGVLASLADRRLLARGSVEPGPELPQVIRSGLRAMALALVLASITFVVTWFHTSTELGDTVRYDLLVWGGGHVLQLACAVAMVSVWLLLVGSATGASPVSARGASLLFAALVIPWTLAPLFAMEGRFSGASRTAFTQLMQWGLFPVVSIFLLRCLAGLHRAGRAGTVAWRDLRVIAFGVSALLTVLGFALGAAIRGSNTMVPAHYHASVGGVTVSFMAAAYLLLDRLGYPIKGTLLRRAAALQPLLYGGGMALFAAGFALAGAHGMGRKMYGAEQATRGFAETLGLLGMGIGGFVAIAGGLLFLGIVAAAWRRRVVPGHEAELALSASSWRWA